MPIRLSILNDAGETIYTVKESSLAEDDLMLRLDKGEYRIYLSDFAGGGFDISYQFE